MKHSSNYFLTTVVAFVATALCAESIYGQTKQPASAPKPQPVKSICFSPDGKLLAAVHAGKTGELAVWNVAEQKPIFVIPDGKPLTNVAFAPAGDRLAIGTQGKKIKLLDAATGEVAKELAGHTARVTAVAFTPDGKQLVSASDDHTIKFWNLATGEVAKEIPGYQHRTQYLAVSADGRWLAAAGEDEEYESQPRLWDLTQADKPPQQFAMNEGFNPRLAFSTDGQFLALPSYLGQVQIIAVQSGTKDRLITNIGGGHDAVFSPDGQWLAVASNGPDVRLFSWQPPAGSDEQKEIKNQIAKFQSDDYAVREAATKRLRELGGVAVAQLRAQLDNADPEVRVRCRRLWQELQNADHAAKLPGHSGGTDCLACSPDSKLIAGGDASGAIRLWHPATQKLTATLRREPAKPLAK
jgi:WD40 repeat protein